MLKWTIEDTREIIRIIKERLSKNPTSQEYVDYVVEDSFKELNHTVVDRYTRKRGVVYSPVSADMERKTL